MSQPLKAPFPYYGGKSWIAAEVWARFGKVRNFVEPFAGSLGILLGRPTPFEGVETINDADGFVSNFWRAISADPAAVAHAADWPVNENCLHARHAWLVGKREDITRRLEGDPDWFDAKAAGWWAWGLSCWIGSGFCSGRGPWGVVVEGDGSRQLVHLGDSGQGVNRKLVHLGDSGRGDGASTENAGRLLPYFEALADRLRNIRVCCGDFARVLGPSVTNKHGLTAVLLDPPYADESDRTADLYSVDSGTVAHRAREWAVANGDDPLLRIALCGYEGEHAMPDGWHCFEWKARGGYGSQGDGQGRENSARERAWFSPHCLNPESERYPMFGRFSTAEAS